MKCLESRWSGPSEAVLVLPAVLAGAEEADPTSTLPSLSR